MSLKRITHAFIASLLTFIIAACATGPRTVNITESEIQAKMAEKLNTTVKLLKIFDVDLANPIVKLDPSTNRLTTKLDASIKSPFNDETLLGNITFSGVPSFDAATQTVKLIKPKLESLNINGLGGKFGDLLKALTDSFGDEMLADIPLYALKENDLKVGNTQYQPRDFKVQDSGLLVTLVPKE